MFGLPAIVLTVIGSPIGRALLMGAGALLAIVAAYGVGNLIGGNRADAKWEARALQNQIDTLHTDLKIQTDMAAIVQQAIVELEAKASASAGREKELSDYVAAHPNNACLASDADVRWLSYVGGKVDRRPDSPTNPARLRKPSPAR